MKQIKIGFSGKMEKALKSIAEKKTAEGGPKWSLGAVVRHFCSYGIEDDDQAPEGGA